MSVNERRKKRADKDNRRRAAVFLNGAVVHLDRWYVLAK